LLISVCSILLVSDCSCLPPTRLANVYLASDLALFGASCYLSFLGVGEMQLALANVFFSACLFRTSVMDLGRLGLLSALLWVEYLLLN
jgi:hypothetical protein